MKSGPFSQGECCLCSDIAVPLEVIIPQPGGASSKHREENKNKSGVGVHSARQIMRDLL